MRRIVKVHYPQLEQHLMDQAIAAFYWVRSLPSLQKKPSTSELIDWIRALTYSGIPMDQITTQGWFLSRSTIISARSRKLSI